MVGRPNIIRAASLILGGLATVAAFFFGTLFVLNYLDGRGRDQLRTEHVKSIMAALEKYHTTRGLYPTLPAGDVEIVQLQDALVGGGYLRSVPTDPLWPDRQYRYASFTGKDYGLLIHLELASGKIPAGGTCMVFVGGTAPSWWGRPPDCPF